MSSTPFDQSPDWVNDAVFYQIFPERFANGDGSINPPDVESWNATPTRDNFLGGDFKGMIENLDHIVDLGANAIYLTPIFQADTNHRYDATDYFSIDGRLGGLSAFREFLHAAHERGLKVVLDAVFNHCGEGHWAFRDVVEKESHSRYVNWFSVEGFPVQSHPEPNYRTCSGCYYLPKWNAYNPEVKSYLFAVAEHWLKEGIDGWRLDVPYFINHTFWREFRQVVRSVSPDAYIVAEEWRDPVEWLDGTLADGTMNYTLRDQILAFTADQSLSAQDVAAAMNALNERIPSGHHSAMLNLLGSHDTERVLTRHGGDSTSTGLAYALMFAAGGAPMIYYGDEVGMVGDNDPGCRAGMVWARSQWNTKLLELIKNWTKFRARRRELRRGQEQWHAITSETLAVTRWLADSCTMVLVNRGNTPTTLDRSTVTALSPQGSPKDLAQWTIEHELGMTQENSDSSITVAPNSCLVLTGEARR